MRTTRMLLLLLLVCAHAFSQPLTLKATGLTGDAKKNVGTTLTLLTKSFKNPSKQRLHKIIESAPNNIRNALKPYGYFAPTIHHSKNRTKKGLLITYQITPGPRVIVTSVSITLLGAGRHDTTFTAAANNLPLKANTPLDTPAYEKAKDTLFDMAANRGYFLAKMNKSQIKIDRTTHTATITLVFNTGPRFLFGKTTIRDKKLAPSFLRRFLPYHYHDPYLLSAIQHLRQDLSNSGYFSRVEIIPDINQAKHHHKRSIPIHILLKDRASRRYTLGVGFGTDTGPRALLGMNWKPVNRYGHSFNASWRAATKNSFLALHYIIPGKNPATDNTALTIGYATEENGQGEANSKSIAIAKTSQLGTWQQILSLKYLNERYNLKDEPRTDANMLIPSATWNLIKSNNNINPSKGYRISFQASGASKAILSHHSFFQVKAQTKYLNSFFDKSSRLILRATAGHTIIKNISNLPLSQQLLAGGANSVRGYSYQGIGPGRNIFVGSVEWQQRIKGDWYGGIFFDAGTVSNKLFGALKKSIGPSLVWLSPVGQIEISLAKPLDANKSTLHLQFSMGPVL